MAQLKYYQAVSAALAEEMEADATTLLMGEDVGRPGGIYAQTRGLQERFGPDRVRDTPAGEIGFMGAAVGLALTGMRPIVEISFADFFPTCMDQVVNQMAKIRYMSGGQATMPVTVMSFGGAGLNAGPQHSGTYEAWLGSMPGLKTVCAATPGDVKGLLKTAVRSDDPVFVLMHKGLLQQRENVPDGDHLVPLGEAAVRREGTDLTIAAWLGGLRPSLAAAETLAGEGVSAEVIDLRSIQPLDVDAVLDSVVKTSRLLVVQETVGFSGIGAELCARVAEDAFDFLDAPPTRVACPFVPVPMSPPLEDFVLPGAEDVVAAARELLA
jgi:acetoin:2,6-dichlorophenolindophenol oxidoreductase subunit beta